MKTYHSQKKTTWTINHVHGKNIYINSSLDQFTKINSGCIKCLNEKSLKLQNSYKSFYAIKVGNQGHTHNILTLKEKTDKLK